MSAFDRFRNRYFAYLVAAGQLLTAAKATAGNVIFAASDLTSHSITADNVSHSEVYLLTATDTISPITRLMPEKTLANIGVTSTPQSVLMPGMRGITMAKDGFLEVSYTFAKTDKITPYETPAMQADGYLDSRPLNAMERQATLLAMQQYEQARIRFVEAEDSSQAYFSCWHFDMNTVMNHSSGRPGVGGSCGYPNVEGTTLFVGQAHNLATLVDILSHELGHGIGQPHTFEDLDLPKHLHGFASSDMNYSGQGNPLGMAGPRDLPSLVTTPGPVDFAYLFSQYGQRERAPTRYEVNLDSAILRSFVIMPDDTLHIFANQPNIVNPRGGVENASIVENGGAMFVTQTPGNVVVGGQGKHWIVQGANQNLTVQDGDATIFSASGGSVTLGSGNENIVLPLEPGKITIQGFNPITDSLFYDSELAAPIKTSDGKGGTLLQCGKLQVTLPGCRPDFVTTAPISKIEQEILINQHRDNITLTPGDNGIIHGYNPKMHSLQFNEDVTTHETMFADVVYSDGKSDVTFLNQNLDTVASFTLLSQTPPDAMHLYFNGYAVRLYDTNYHSPDGSEAWKDVDGWLTKLQDMRKTAEPWICSVNSNSLVKTSVNTNFIVTGEGATASHVQVPEQNKEMELFIHRNVNCSLNRFRVGTDKISCNADSATITMMSDSTAFFTFYHGLEKSELVVQTMQGSLDSLALANYSNGDPIPLHFIAPSDLSFTKKLYISSLLRSALKLEAATNRELDEGVEDPVRAPQSIWIIPPSSKGRG